MNALSVHQPRTGESETGKPLSFVLARNTVYSLLTQAGLIIAAVWSIPRVVHGLSAESFGLLSLVWAFLGYFSLLDFGISRANTKFLSDALALRNEDEVRGILWSSVIITCLLGIVAMGLMMTAIPFIITRLFHIPPSLYDEANRAFLLSAISIPFMLVFGTLKGFQIALQRFDVVNLFQAALGIAQWLGAVIVISMGLGIQEVILLSVGARIILSICALALLPRLHPRIFAPVNVWRKERLRKLFSYGGWITVSQILNPLFIYADRFFIGYFLTLSAVSYYTVPQEGVMRLSVIPMSMTMTLFPAMARIAARPINDGQSSLLYNRVVKYLFYVMLPIALILVGFAPEILRTWMGADFASQSGSVLQVLAIGALVNALAYVPMTVHHAHGRPDLPAKFHLMELPLMILLNFALIPKFGVMGAAISWTIRAAVDAGLLFWFAGRDALATPRAIEPHRILWRVLVSALPMAAILGLVLFLRSGTIRLILVAGLGLSSAAIIWIFGLDEFDKRFLARIRLWFFN
jgi:O-antigen/teichoic acid export membrane protein